MVLCLTGMPGCGKSSVGRLLAERSAVPFHDLDMLIETRSGRSIREIFRTDGEPVFRTLEHEVLAAVLSVAVPGNPPAAALEHAALRTLDCVLALGGGTVMTAACAELVRLKTCCIYLRARAETLCRRLSADGQTELRPLLSPVGAACPQPIGADGPAALCDSISPLRQRIEELLAEREPVYSATARFTIDTDTLSPAGIADEIRRRLLSF